MSTYTTNYNLEKPDASDNFEDFRANYNQNMDIIDQNLGGGGGSSSLAGLSDVSITSAQDGQVLKYDAQNSEWINANESGGGSYTAGDGIDITSNAISVDTAFTEAGTRQNINSGDTFATILGKIKKFFTDLKTVAFSGSYTDLTDKPTIPTATSDLVNDSDFVSDASYVHTDENFTSAEKTKLSGIEAGAEVNVQSDWNEADNTADDYIKNKPSIPTNTSDLNNDSGFLTSADVSTVAISGDYDDLLNKPTIPTKVSDLNNDSGFTSVSWNQIQASGTKIAEIDIDGTTTDVYAPQGSGGGGGYETIEDADGTALTQRDTVQFEGYLKSTDDNVNSKTKVSDAPTEITWDNWQNLTTAQKEGTKWLIKDVPSADGSVEADLLNLLWTNPNDNVSFSAQNITLSSADYDYLLIVARLLEGASSEVSAIVKKGGSIPLDHSYYSNGVRVRRRVLVYNTDTSYSVGDATDQGGTYNQCLIPMAIYGIKQKITVSFDALAESVSTLASKCMLSDGDSVEDKFSSSASPLANFNASLTKVNNLCVLGLASPKSAMTKNVAFNAGTLEEKYRPNQTILLRMIGNGRSYDINISTTGVVQITCYDNLPSSGVPTLGITVPYITN